MSTALQQAIEALLIEQREREELLQRLIALNNGQAAIPNGRGRPPRVIPAKAPPPAAPPLALKRAQKDGPIARIWAYVHSHETATFTGLRELGLTGPIIHAALRTLQRERLIVRSGTPKHYVYRRRDTPPPPETAPREPRVRSRTGPLAIIWAYLQRHETATSVDLRTAGVQPTSLHSALRSLIRQGFVRRTGTRPHYVYRRA